jgi:hypothetical protein
VAETIPTDCPFRPGASYRVRQDFEAFRDTFREGEILIFRRDAFSRYDGMHGYMFSSQGNDGCDRVWDTDIYPNPIPTRNVKLWKDFFEEVDLSEAGLRPCRGGF